MGPVQFGCPAEWPDSGLPNRNLGSTVLVFLGGKKNQNPVHLEIYKIWFLGIGPDPKSSNFVILF